MERSSLRTLVFSAAVAGAALLAAPSEARADGPVSPTGKGIVGGALLGGEIVTMPMGIAGLKPWWPYLVFGGLGSVGGAIGGWGVERATAGTTSAAGTTTGATAEPALYMLAGGLALLIPTLVVSLNATTKSTGEAALKTTIPILDRTAAKGIIKRETASRHKARLMKFVAKLPA